MKKKKKEEYLKKKKKVLKNNLKITLRPERLRGVALGEVGGRLRHGQARRGAVVKARQRVDLEPQLVQRLGGIVTCVCVCMCACV